MANALDCLNYASNFITSGDCANIKSLTDDLSFKICFDGEIINNMAETESLTLFEIPGKIEIRINNQSGDVYTRFTLYNGSLSTLIESANIAKSNFSTGTFYILYCDSNNSAGDANIDVYEMDGTSVYTKNQGWGQGTFQSVASADVGFGYGIDGPIDCVAIYSDQLTGADKYAEPSDTDTAIEELWFFNEGTGTSVANEISGEPSLSLAGTENTNWSWTTGEWPSGTTPAGELVTTNVNDIAA